jgi:hypothetical protein
MELGQSFDSSSLAILSFLRDEVLGEEGVELQSGLGLGLELHISSIACNIELSQSFHSSSLTILSSLRDGVLGERVSNRNQDSRQS